MKRQQADQSGGWQFAALLKTDAPLLAMAHELKSPLCLIRQLSLFLEEQSLNDNQARSYLDQIRLVSERGLRLVSDLSRIGQIDQLAFDLEPLSPAEVCRQVAQELAGYYQINQRQLKLNLEQRYHYLATANHELLKSILINFCDNALHYADKEHPVEISLSLHKRAEKVRVMVRDRGPRLPLSVWRALKGRQYLVPQAWSSRPLSSGLGIYLAQRFATAMQAEIGAVAHSDGVSFYVDLKLSKQLALL